MAEDNSSGGEQEKEKIKIELEAPADELVIKREPADSASEEEKISAEQSAREAKEQNESAQQNAEADKKQAEEKVKELEHELAEKEEGEEPEEKPEPRTYRKALVIIGCTVAAFGLIIIWPFVSLAAGLAVIALGGIIAAFSILTRL